MKIGYRPRTDRLPGPGRLLRASGLAIMTAALAMPTSVAGAASTKLVSRSSSGAQGSDASGGPSLSATGRFVAFSSSADDLIIGDTNGRADVFVRDVVKGKTKRVSKHSNGAQGNGDSSGPSISADGRYVAFASEASTLVNADTNGYSDVFVRDRKSGETRRVSRKSNGGQANGPSYKPSISADGRFIVFDSDASNLVRGDKNSSTDVFVHDLATGRTQLVSKSSNGKRGNAFSGSSAISQNGRYIIFDSGADNLVKRDTNGKFDVFVHDRITRKTSLVSRNFRGRQGKGESYWPVISGNGRFVAFISDAKNLVRNDTNGFDDVFVRDRNTGKTQRVNLRSNGTQANRRTIRPPTISADGRIIGFESEADNLVKNDTNGFQDVFVHDRVRRKTRRASVASGGAQAKGVSADPVLSADGRFIAFESAAYNLVRSDDAGGVSDVFRRGPLR